MVELTHDWQRTQRHRYELHQLWLRDGPISFEGFTINRRICLWCHWGVVCDGAIVASGRSLLRWSARQAADHAAWSFARDLRRAEVDEAGGVFEDDSFKGNGKKS